MKKAKLLVVMICPLVFQNCFIEEIIPINAKCKSNCVEVTGRFTTEDSFLPIEDVKLELSWIQNCGMTACWFGDASRVIATTKTEANGNYNFRFSVKDHELTGGFFTVAFVPSSDDYVTENRGFTISQPLKRNSTVTHNYHLPTRGQMQYFKHCASYFMQLQPVR